jgi:flavorubredoxin
MTRIRETEKGKSPPGPLLTICPIPGAVQAAAPGKNISAPWPEPDRLKGTDARKGDETMAKVLIVYTSRTGETREIADRLAEGIRFQGVEAEVRDVSSIKSEKDLEGFDGYAFGSPTYHGDMLQPMKTFLFLAEKADLKGKVGGSFGAFGWSGEALDRIYGTMENIFQMHMVGDPLRLKSVTLGGGTQMAQDYGRRIGKKVLSQA